MAALDLFVPIVHNTTYEALREISPLHGSRRSLTTKDDDVDCGRQDLRTGRSIGHPLHVSETSLDTASVHIQKCFDFRRGSCESSFSFPNRRIEASEVIHTCCLSQLLNLFGKANEAALKDPAAKMKNGGSAIQKRGA